MPPVASGARRPRRALSRAVVLGALVVTTFLVAGCGVGGATFDPSGPCVADGRGADAYPELEAMVPAILDGEGPDSLDSGRNCSAENLGTLADHGIAEVRFAGGLWKRGAESGTTLAVFTADGLTAEWLGEFYEDGARSGRKTSGVEVSHPTIDGATAFRLDLVNNGSLQTIVTMDADAEDTVEAVLVSSAARDVADEAAHEAAVTAALEAFGAELGRADG